MGVLSGRHLSVAVWVVPRLPSEFVYLFGLVDLGVFGGLSDQPTQIRFESTLPEDSIRVYVQVNLERIEMLNPVGGTWRSQAAAARVPNLSILYLNVLVARSCQEL